MNPLSRLIRSVLNSETRTEDASASLSTSVTAARLEELIGLAQKLAHDFEHFGLLDCAFTHRSYSNYELRTSDRALRDYESLEFLGDAVLGFVISEALLVHYPRLGEGELTKMKAALVSTEQLSSMSFSLGLGDYLRLGPGEE